MRFSFQHKGQVYEVDLEPTPEGYHARMGDHDVDVQVRQSNATGFRFSIGGKEQRAVIAFAGTQRWIHIDGRTFILTHVDHRSGRGRLQSSGDDSAEGLILSPMPGQVLAVFGSQGDLVEQGQTLLLLEAMKMEIKVQAPRGGKLVRFDVIAGQAVDREQVLGEIKD